MTTTLRETTRRARKPHYCGMCSTKIRPGDTYRVTTMIHDGDLYDWRECLPCDRDGIGNLVRDWTGGYYDEGVGYEQASEWAEEAMEWPKRWSRLVPNRRIGVAERFAARSWLARAAGGEGE